MACSGTPSGGTQGGADSLFWEAASTDGEEIETHWVTGFVGTGTSMNTIELVSAEASDTLWLELDDETVREATLQVGQEIRALVTDEADGALRVLATKDVE